MADTLEQMAGRLLVYVPFLPLPLAEQWLRDRWRQANEYRHWSFLRAGTIISTPALYSTGTIALTENSGTVTGTNTVWTSAMINRQLLVGAQAPIFNITAVASGTSLTIDPVWPKADASGKTYSLLKAYVTMPANFLMFRSVVDPDNAWRLHAGFHDQEYLDRIDPQRSSQGTPYVLAAFRDYIDPTTSVESARYELWPHPSAARAYPVLYTKRAADLSSTTVLPRVITGDILILGALADLCRWPGPHADTKNPMFSLPLAMDYERRFTERLAEAGRQDNEIYQTDLIYDSWPLAPISHAFAQSHGMTEPDIWW